MNKLLLFALLGLTLIALTAGSEENEENKEIEALNAREIREAGKNNKKAKKARKNKKANKKKSRKSGKKKNKKVSRKMKKNKKAAKKNKKAAKKNKKAGKKNKKAEKKQKKAGKKQKKSGRKLKKRKQQKTGRKAKMNRKQKQASGTRSASSCLNFTCIDKAIGYLNMHKGKVANFKKQNSRVARQNKTSTSKSGKKGLFGPIVRRITHMGGGNASNLTCHGKKNAGAAQLTNLTETLLKCEDEIHNNCHPSNMPQPNMTKHAPCLEAIETFENKSNGCIKKTGSEACTCWEDKDLAAAAAVIKKCDLSSDANKFKAALKKCTSSFGKCRKYEDDVAAAIHACNLDDKVLVKKLKNLNTNKNALSKLQDKINSATNTSRSVRSSGRALSCSVVITTTETVVSLVTQNPTSYSIFTLIQTVVTATFTCTETEKTSLKASGTKVATAITVVSLEITHVQTSYAAINGKEATDSEIDAADTCKTEDECDGLVELDTTTAPATTASVTEPTQAPTPAPASETAAPPPASTEAPAPASTAAPSEGETPAPMPASTVAASAGETPVPVPASTAAAPASETPVALPASTPSAETTQAPSKAPETTAPAPVSTPQMATRRARQHIQHIMRKRMVETLI